MNLSELSVDPVEVSVRFKKRMTELGYTNAAKTARDAGIPYKLFHNWLSGTTKGQFGSDPFIRICIYLKSHPSFMLWGQQVEYRDEALNHHIDTNLLAITLASTLRHMEAMNKQVTPAELAEVTARLYSLEVTDKTQQILPVIKYEPPNNLDT